MAIFSDLECFRLLLKYSKNYQRLVNPIGYFFDNFINKYSRIYLFLMEKSDIIPCDVIKIIVLNLFISY
jgi:hypothetical protein